MTKGSSSANPKSAPSRAALAPGHPHTREFTATPSTSPGTVSQFARPARNESSGLGDVLDYPPNRDLGDLGTPVAFELARGRKRIRLPGPGLPDDDFDFTLVRYLTDGSLDPSFGDGSIMTTDFSGSDDAFALALLPDGRIVAAGATRLEI